MSVSTGLSLRSMPRCLGGSSSCRLVLKGKPQLVLDLNWQADGHRFLSTLSTRMMERTGEFVQIADLDHDDLSEVLCHPGAMGHAKPKQPKNVIIRTERQTFRRLPRTQAIVFAVKTWMRTLPELADHELAKFQREIHSWPDDVAQYKGRNMWAGTVDAYCARRLH